jgi:putative transposase
MIKRYRYRLYPTRDQVEFLARSFGCARVVFNDALAVREEMFRAGEKAPSAAALMQAMSAAKKTPERAWLAEVSDVPLQQSIRDLDRAYTDFFRRLKAKTGRAGKPRFKSSRDSTQSLRFTRAHFRVEKINRTTGMLKLPKMDPVRMKLSRPLPSELSSVTVIREADGRYYASFVVDAPVRPAPAPVHPVAGIDLGLNHLAVIAYEDGSAFKVGNPRHLRKKLRKLARAQKEHARRQKGSTNRERSRAKVAAIHRKVRQTRADHHHKLARKIVDENQVIGLETLGISGLGRTRLAKSVYDASWGLLVRLIEEKALEAGRTVIRAARDFPSTRLCSVCGTIGEKKALHVRFWTCECGATHDRDINAAVNLLHVAAGQAETKNDCGGALSRRPRTGARSRETVTTPQAAV